MIDRAGGKLDQISHAIGSLEASVQGLHEDLRDNRKVADRRHEENSSKLTDIEQKLAPVIKTVQRIEPIVDSLQTLRTKAAVWGTIGFGVLLAVGWALEVVIKTLIDWFASHFR